jgi:UDP-N-acetylmuramoyl-tripeptide--D-alanyl-D-alanine ligase
MEISELYKIYQKHPNVSIDSRNVKENSIFFSIKGPNFDGNKYAKKAISNGAKYAIVNDKKLAAKNNFIFFEDTLKVLQTLANFHRKKLKIPIIAITGTNGKTTSKELIKECLGTQINTAYTKGNLNNHIGVPLTLLEIKLYDHIAIIEMGANHPKEIKELCNIAEPNYGIITNIGLAHLEGFKSLDGVKKTKKELYDYIKSKNGKIFVNSDDKVLNKISSGIEKISYGLKGNISGKIDSNKSLLKINYKDNIIQSNLSGDFQFYNIMLSICIANYFGIKTKNIVSAISKYIPKNNRSQILNTEKNKIILDAYNANPSSMKASLESFKKNSELNKICIIGDMLELGDYSDSEHKKIIGLVSKLNLKCYFVGSIFKSILGNNSFTSNKELINEIKENPIEGYTIFIKGSRGIKLEELVKYL